MAEANKRNIPIKLGDFSVIDTEFSNIRERFDSEMRKMEEEMAKFRHELMNREANFFESTSSTKKTTTTRYNNVECLQPKLLFSVYPQCFTFTQFLIVW
ncbi:GD17451 [Drosophila simulans]|uniref:GD17451 n=1 Tax=Drosophila simulans TaxID=7240 RepID=B4R7S1_DROSI|nr:GD17451 [Drosophila simulans]